MRAPLLLAAAIAAAATGCAAPSMYHWDRYDERLYQHYKHPQDREAWVTSLRVTVAEAAEYGRKVPPGLQAELGYALLEEGQPQEAIGWFEKERAQWPESRPFMEKMIEVAKRTKPAPPGAKGAAGATEGTL
jgi:hypothetical protein